MKASSKLLFYKFTGCVNFALDKKYDSFYLAQSLMSIILSFKIDLRMRRNFTGKKFYSIHGLGEFFRLVNFCGILGVNVNSREIYAQIDLLHIRAYTERCSHIIID